MGLDNASTELLASVTRLRDALSTSSFPLTLPGVEADRRERTQLLDQLDDYVIPRLSAIDAPVLAVVGGSTGAGKSTLVNSIIGREVSQPGVLRPTTRSPVLIHHPSDARWFGDDRILPGLARVTGAPRPGATSADTPSSAVRLVPTDAIDAGLALLDAPDIDSVVAANRDLAGQLLAAADLWIFVTTAARYADAVPWDLLRQAADRGTSVAIVLDRVPPEALSDITQHLRSMLNEQGLGKAPLFTIAESGLEGGLLPADQIQPLRDWLAQLAGDAKARAEVVRQTLTGALNSLEARSARVATASAAQAAAGAELRDAARAAYDIALDDVKDGAADGTLLRGEVLARWQEFVGTGEFFRQVESTVARVRDRITSVFTGGPARAENLGEALHTGAEVLITNSADAAASSAARTWRGLPGGEALILEAPELARSTPGLTERTSRLVRDWQDDILEMVRDEGKDRRTTARIMAYGVNGLGVVLMLVTFAGTAGVTGAEIGIAGGTAVVGQKLLEAIFGDQAVRELARKSRERLVERVEKEYAAELARFDGVLDAAEVPERQAERITEAAKAVRAAR